MPLTFRVEIPVGPPMAAGHGIFPVRAGTFSSSLPDEYVLQFDTVVPASRARDSRAVPVAATRSIYVANALRAGAAARDAIVPTLGAAGAGMAGGVGSQVVSPALAASHAAAHYLCLLTALAPAEFTVEGLTDADIAAGWSVEPMRGAVAPGQRAEIVVAFAPALSMSGRAIHRAERGIEVSCVASISVVPRGGDRVSNLPKPVRYRLQGSVVVI